MHAVAARVRKGATLALLASAILGGVALSGCPKPAEPDPTPPPPAPGAAPVTVGNPATDSSALGPRQPGAPGNEMPPGGK